MSHVTTIDLVINDLDALERAAKVCGMELKRGQTTFRWYYGNDPCKHAIVLPGNTEAYEIGIVQEGATYKLLFDDYRGGHGLLTAIGERGETLLRAYAMERVKSLAQRNGMMLTTLSPTMVRLTPVGVPAGMAGGPCSVDVNLDDIERIEVEGLGFTGAACDQAMGPVEQALGIQTGRTNKPDYGVADFSQLGR